MYWFIYLIIAIFLITLFISTYLAYISSHPKVQSKDIALDLEFKEKSYDLDYLNKLNKEEISILVRNSYHIKGFWLPCDIKSNKAIIIVHGYECTLYRSIKYVETYKQLGYSVFVYDQRFHGSTGGKNSTFGYYEKQDLKDIIGYIKSNYIDNSKILGIMGSSMGGAVCLQTAAIDDRVDFVISESTFSTLSSQFSYQLKYKFHTPIFPILLLASLINKIINHYYFKDVNNIKAISNIKMPVFIIHGDKDQFLPVIQSKQLFDSIKSKQKKYYIAKGAGHGKVFNINKTEYNNQIKSFFEENGL